MARGVLCPMVRTAAVYLLARMTEAGQESAADSPSFHSIVGSTVVSLMAS